MKVSMKQWREIQNYIFKHAREIWDLAVSHADSEHNAIVWLDGISSGGKYKLRAGRYTTKIFKKSADTLDSILVYQLPKDWADNIEIYDNEPLYDAGYEDFLEKLHYMWFWLWLENTNGLEIVE